MFGFHIGIPSIYFSEEIPIASIDIDGYGEVLSGSTRDIFYEIGIQEEYEKHCIVDENGMYRYNTPIKYSVIKERLEKIRYTAKMYGSDRLWIDESIKKAIQEYGEENLYCMFT